MLGRLKGAAMPSLAERLCLLFILFTTASSIAFADLLTPADEVIETMMQAQGQDLTWLVRFYGNDSSAILHFSSTVNVGGRTFSFSVLPGATYQGMPFTMSTIGSGNSTNAWQWTTMASLGTHAWSTTGSGQYIDPPNFDAIDVFIIVPEPLLDQHSHVTYDQTASRTVSTETTSFTMHDPITGMDTVYQTSQRFDTHVLQGPDAGKWVWSDDSNKQVDGHTLKIDSEGFSPINGGAGSFTVVFAPETSSGLLSASGLAALLCLAIARSRVLTRERETATLNVNATRSHV
jgi:hypothetical protein